MWYHHWPRFLSVGAVMPNEESASQRSGLSRTDLLPIALPVSGFLLYGALAAANTYYYTALGTSPDEVGFTYANTIGRSLGFVIIIVLATILAIAVAYFLAKRRPESRADEQAVVNARQTEERRLGRQLNAIEDE